MTSFCKVCYFFAGEKGLFYESQPSMCSPSCIALITAIFVFFQRCEGNIPQEVQSAFSLQDSLSKSVDFCSDLNFYPLT